jgi:hypothetical protein
MQMSARAEAFDRWIRGAFVAINTELEELYFRQDDRSRVEGVGDPLKARLRDEGHVHVIALLEEGNTGDGFASAFNVLGNVGLYLGALRRHELTNPAREERSPFPEASSLALHVGASLGMAPRFATSHLATHNRAIHGIRKSFTSLRDEFCSSTRTRAASSRCRRRRCAHAHRASRRDQPRGRCVVRHRETRARGRAAFQRAPVRAA